jgi:hypothetical protein
MPSPIAFTGSVLAEDSVSLRLLPAETEAGDTVVVLDGARVPFVLRQTIRGLKPRPLREAIVLDEFTVIGDCYVHGIMLGEFMGHGAEARDFALQ